MGHDMWQDALKFSVEQKAAIALLRENFVTRVRVKQEEQQRLLQHMCEVCKHQLHCHSVITLQL